MMQKVTMWWQWSWKSRAHPSDENQEVMMIIIFYDNHNYDDQHISSYNDADNSTTMIIMMINISCDNDNDNYVQEPFCPPRPALPRPSTFPPSTFAQDLDALFNVSFNIIAILVTIIGTIIVIYASSSNFAQWLKINQHNHNHLPRLLKISTLFSMSASTSSPSLSPLLSSLS